LVPDDNEHESQKYSYNQWNSKDLKLDTKETENKYLLESGKKAFERVS